MSPLCITFVISCLITGAIMTVLAYKEGKRDGTDAGYTAGLEHGKAKGWLEYYDTEQAKDKARRDRIGRFRAKQKGAV